MRSVRRTTSNSRRSKKLLIRSRMEALLFARGSGRIGDFGAICSTLVGSFPISAHCLPATPASRARQRRRGRCRLQSGSDPRLTRIKGWRGLSWPAQLESISWALFVPQALNFPPDGKSEPNPDTQHRRAKRALGALCENSGRVPDFSYVRHRRIRNSRPRRHAGLGALPHDG